tara:strand:- start:1050 stop:1328 length:279 start_codon:yes stop_codon:yes gene_type:complete
MSSFSLDRVHNHTICGVSSLNKFNDEATLCPVRFNLKVVTGTTGIIPCTGTIKDGHLPAIRGTEILNVCGDTLGTLNVKEFLPVNVMRLEVI